MKPKQKYLNTDQNRKKSIKEHKQLNFNIIEIIFNPSFIFGYIILIIFILFFNCYIFLYCIYLTLIL